MLALIGRLALVGGASLFTGCAASNADILHFLREHEYAVSATEYRIGIPDSIAITAPQIPEVDGTFRRIQPDGKINLELLGDVKVVGLTAKEVAAKLEILLSRYYRDPKVSAFVDRFASKKYYIHGQVQSAGARPYTGRDTLLDAVLASGITFQSNTRRITVTRPSHDDEPVRKIYVNADEMLRKGDWSKNILLEPNDIVYIPPTPLAWVALRLRELIFPVTPVIQAYTTPLEFAYAQDDYELRGQGIRGRRSIRR